MNKKCLFGITNALLVGIVGLLVGLFCQSIFTTGVGVCAFVLLLVALCLPSVIYMLADKIGQAGLILSVLLIFAEVVINIVFMAKPATDGKIVAIVQASVIGAILIAMLITIAVTPKKAE